MSTGCLAKDVQKLLRNIGSMSGGQARVVEWDPDDLETLFVEISPSDGPYRYGKFKFKFNMGENGYPDGPPRVTCLTNIYHPNIDTTEMDPDDPDWDADNICLNLLSGGEWESNHDLEDCVQGLLFLFYEPNMDDPLTPMFNPGMCDDEFEFNVYLSLKGEEVDGFTFEQNYGFAEKLETDANEFAKGILDELVENVFNDTTGDEDKNDVVTSVLNDVIKEVVPETNGDLVDCSVVAPVPSDIIKEVVPERNDCQDAVVSLTNLKIEDACQLDIEAKIKDDTETPVDMDEKEKKNELHIDGKEGNVDVDEKDRTDAIAIPFNMNENEMQHDVELPLNTGPEIEDDVKGCMKDILKNVMDANVLNENSLETHMDRKEVNGLELKTETKIIDNAPEVEKDKVAEKRVGNLDENWNEYSSHNVAVSENGIDKVVDEKCHNVTAGEMDISNSDISDGAKNIRDVCNVHVGEDVDIDCHVLDGAIVGDVNTAYFRNIENEGQCHIPLLNNCNNDDDFGTKGALDASMTTKPVIRKIQKMVSHLKFTFLNFIKS